MPDLTKRDTSPPDPPTPLRSGDHVGILVPCKLEEFGDFITGLIGKPQTVRGEVEGVFDITPKDVANVFHLVNQRVHKQNEGTLASFEIKTTYDNGTSVSHQSVEDFESYYPTLPGKPEEIVISFTYLIKFQRSQVPEKQVIEFVFSASPNKKRTRLKWYAGGLIEWRIKHTERTWASDMNGLLKNHASHCIDSSSGIWKWLTHFHEEVIHYFGLAVVIGVTVKWLFSTFSFLDHSPNYIQLAKYYTASGVTLLVLYLLIGSIVRTITVYLVVKRDSYICLIDKDLEHKEKDLRRSISRLLMYFGSFVVAVIAGVVATFVYDGQWARGL